MRAPELASACAIAQEMDRLLATPTTSASLPDRSVMSVWWGLPFAVCRYVGRPTVSRNRLAVNGSARSFPRATVALWTASALAHRSAVPLRPSTALTPALAACGPARVATVAAPFGETSRARVVVLEPAPILVRLTDREFGHRTRNGLALDARQLRSNQRPVQPHFLRCSLRRSAAVVAVRWRVLCLLRVVLDQR